MGFSEPLQGIVEQMRDLSTGPSLTAVSESEDKLIISLDFGTMFSGIAYYFPKQKNANVGVIMNWPGGEGQALPKIPTLIRYDPDDKNNFTWGASVDKIADSVIGIKLLLDPSQERPTYLPSENILQNLSKLPKQPVEIAADFIGAVYQHALKEICRVVPKSYISICQKHFVLSVPAVWSDAAKNATLQAAEMAGIFPVTLINEPEAAALYTIRSLDFTLNVGDAFVICDAGGGTVDLISYEVVKIKPVLQLKELVPGTGGMAGSLGLNQRFAESVKKLVGEKKWQQFRTSKSFFLAERSFEREVKKAFKGRADEEYYVSFPMAKLPDNTEAGLEADCWKLTGAVLEEIFRPLVEDILKLINNQVQAVAIKRPGKGAKGIFLVGGFGSSQYLKARVMKQHPTIDVMQPADAWSAIMRGSALSKLPREAAIISTCATRHYGVEAWSVYDPIEDGEVETKLWRDGTTRAATMTWYINVGEDMLRDQVTRFPFYRTLIENYDSNGLVFRDILYESHDLEAPRHRCRSKGTVKNCELVSDLRNVPSSQFIKVTDSEGKPYYRVHYDLVISTASALMTFSLEFDGKRMGTARAEYK